MSAAASHAASVLTHLANPDRLIVLAELARRGDEGGTVAELAGSLDLPVARVGDACSRLVGLKVATGTGSGPYRPRLDGLREAAEALTRTQPISSLLGDYPQLKSYFAYGRVKELPPTGSDRYELIGELLARFLHYDGMEQGDLFTEAEVNDRLTKVTDDVAGARRMLVETGWLGRDRAGSTYGLARLPVLTA